MSEKKRDKNFKVRFIADFRRNKQLYIMMIPIMLFFIIFSYLPMYGAIIAFKDYRPGRGFMGSEWVGLKHFIRFFTAPSFGKVLGNTVKISLSTLVFGFPAPIVLALLMNEISNKKFVKVVQNFTYMPHFISMVVMCGMITDFTRSNGLIGNIVSFFGGEPVSLLNYPQYFLPVYVVSNIWEGIGWGSIIYLAALTGVDRQLYEAAEIDGAGRFKQMLHITLPGITPTIVTMLVLRMGQILSVGYEKIILLYNEANRSAADVISSYVYRQGLLDANFSYSAAVGLFNSVVNFTLVICANALNKKLRGESLW